MSPIRLGLLKNPDARIGAEFTGVEFQFDGMEYTEYRRDLSEKQSSNAFFSDIRVSTRQA
jgi:hypothetical protein